MEITTIDSSQKEDMANNQRDILLWGSFFKKEFICKRFMMFFIRCIWIHFLWKKNQKSVNADTCMIFNTHF